MKLTSNSWNASKIKQPSKFLHVDGTGALLMWSIPCISSRSRTLYVSKWWCVCVQVYYECRSTICVWLHHLFLATLKLLKIDQDSVSHLTALSSWFHAPEKGLVIIPCRRCGMSYQFWGKQSLCLFWNVWWKHICTNVRCLLYLVLLHFCHLFCKAVCFLKSEAWLILTIIIMTKWSGWIKQCRKCAMNCGNKIIGDAKHP